MSQQDSAPTAGDDDLSDIVSMFDTVHDQMDRGNLVSDGQQYAGITNRSARVWSHALQCTADEFSQLRQASEAIGDLQKRIENAENDLYSARVHDDVREQLSEFTRLNDEQVRQNTVNLVKDFLNRNPEIIPDLQSEGFALGAKSFEAVRRAQVAMSDISARNDRLRERHTANLVDLNLREIKIHDLKLNLIHAEQELDNLRPLQGRLDTLIAKHKAMSTELQKSIETNSNLEQNGVQQRSDIRGYRLRLDEANDTIDALRADLTRQSEARTAADREKDSLKAALPKAHQETEQLRLAHSRLNRAFNSARSNAESQARQWDSERTACNDQIREIRESLKLQEQELDQVRSDKARLEDDCQNLQQTCVSRSDDVAKVEHQRQLAMNDAHELRIELNNSKQTNDDIGCQLHLSRTTITAYEEQMVGLRDHVRQLEERLETTSSRNQSEQEQATNRIRDLEGQLEQNRQAYAQLERQSEAKSIWWRGQHSRAEARHNDVKSNLESTLNLLQTRSDELLTESNNTAQLRHEYNQVSQARVAEQQEASDTISKLKDDLNDLQWFIQQYSTSRSQQIDFAGLLYDWRNIVVAESLRLRPVPMPFARIIGLTSTQAVEDRPIRLALETLVQSHTRPSDLKGSQIEQLAKTLEGRNQNAMLPVAAILYQLILRRASAVSENSLTFASSVILLRSIELFCCLIRPECDEYRKVHNLTLNFPQESFSSSVLARSLLDCLISQFNGENLRLVSALRNRSVLNDTRAENRGWMFIREEKAMVVVPPTQEVIFARPKYLRVQNKAELFPMPMTSGFYRIIFQDCPFIGTDTTDWWTLSEIFDAGKVFRPLLVMGREYDLLSEDDSLREI